MSMGLLDGKVAIVTGAGAGIGRGVARVFVREGAKVMVAELNQANGTKTVEDIRRDIGGDVEFVHADIGDAGSCAAAVQATVDRFGGFDVLVNNASALTPNVLLEDKTDAMLARTLGVGLWGTWWMMRASLPHLKARGGGRIINFYSIDTDAAAWLHADYNATKGAIQGLTRSAAVEWGRFNILVNAIAPAAIGTVYAQLCEENPGFGEAMSALNPLGRVGDPETDIAPALVFLASDMSRYITGETINVDGGQHLPRYNSKPAGLGNS
jgi:NAD(P)-dependent dehydrogenase (short-subunit alcohol dehydrogenase family)